MRITVINGTEKHGVTYMLKEILLDELRDRQRKCLASVQS